MDLPTTGSSNVVSDVPRFGLLEHTFTHAGNYDNPYMELTATAELVEPDGETTRALPLFWDGGTTWKFRFSPDRVGTWQWTVRSEDGGLDGQTGSFRVVHSDRRGSIRPMSGSGYHFERQDGSPFWFMGDTAWALYTDDEANRHDRQAAVKYVDARQAQGFNVLHSMLLSEAGWGNSEGPPFDDIGAEKINTGYWREVDWRLDYATRRGIVAGLVLIWGAKQGKESYAWKRLPTLEARKRYARHIAARYGAFDVFFLVAGEWHGEVRTTPGATEESIKPEFIAVGEVLKESDPHGRMIAIHPMTSHGSVREFVETSWMSFGDYQQNYRELHARILLSRTFDPPERPGRPIVNSEYAYYLRDQDGDGKPDKSNSFTLDIMRHATWDIVMAGGYFVTGFGTTYFGGNRDPGPFDVDAEKNDDWEEDVQHVQALFTSLPWWDLEPHDELLTCAVDRGRDGTYPVQRRTRNVEMDIPPAVAYWALAAPGRQYVIYMRGHEGRYEVSLGDAEAAGTYRMLQFDPRTGEYTDLGTRALQDRVEYDPPDARDWVLLLERIGSA